MEQASKGNPIQGFAPSEIRNGVTTLDLNDVEAIRISADAEYYINGALASKAIMPAGATVISGRINELTFTSATTVEIMKA
ncbi:hypothetical protein [Pontibacterium sp.]|uniref:hypothetical protein n=1 Tax=Pontibacterium sp. TaxID=2036026 RepID=UPI00356A44C7